MQNMAVSDEFTGLAPEIRDRICEFLAECPVKLGALARQLGIRVLVSRLPNNISGRVDREENGDFVIRINRYEARSRQRFTLAHEIAHILLHEDLVVAEGGLSHDVLMRSGQPAQIEHEANRLALDLIVPSALLADVAAENPGPMTDDIIEDLALRFKVTCLVMKARLQEGIAERHQEMSEISGVGVLQP